MVQCLCNIIGTRDIVDCSNHHIKVVLADLTHHSDDLSNEYTGRPRRGVRGHAANLTTHQTLKSGSLTDMRRFGWQESYDVSYQTTRWPGVPDGLRHSLRRTLYGRGEGVCPDPSSIEKGPFRHSTKLAGLSLFFRLD